METSLLLNERGKIAADGAWFVRVEAHYRISVGRIPIDLGGRFQKKMRRDGQDRDRPYDKALCFSSNREIRLPCTNLRRISDTYGTKL